MKRYFNMMFYVIYRFDYKFHLLFKKINPVVLFHKLVMSEEKHAEYLKDLNGAMEEPKFGVSSMFAAGLLYGLYFLLFFSIFIFFTGVFKFNIGLDKLHGLLLAVPSFIILYYMVFKNDLYLTYFDEFKNIPKGRMRFLSFIYFLNIIGIIGVFVLSLMFTSYRNY